MKNTSFCQGLQLYDNYVILGHEKPDGDAIGAALSMKYMLEKLGKRATVCMIDMDPRYGFMPTFEDIIPGIGEDEEIQALIVVDCGEVSRLGEFQEYFDRAQKTFCIDHHVSKGEIADYNYLDDTASSTCELVYELLKGLQLPLDSTISNLLYEGLCYDTGGFKHSNVSAKVLNMAADLVEHGAKVTEIMYHLFSKRTYTSTKLLGIALANLELYLQGRVAISYLEHKVIEAYQPAPGSTDGIVNMLKDIEGVEVAIFFTETPHKVKASLRSEGLVNVSAFASRYGGGGHVKASGCSIEGDLHTVIKNMINDLKEVIDGRNS